MELTKHNTKGKTESDLETNCLEEQCNLCITLLHETAHHARKIQNRVLRIFTRYFPRNEHNNLLEKLPSTLSVTCPM